MSQPNLPPFQCTKCNGTEANIHLRQVAITMGWALARMETVAPCVLCRSCGDLTVGTNITIGRYIGPLPEEPQPPRGGNVVDLPRAVPPPPEQAPQAAPEPAVVGSGDDR